MCFGKLGISVFAFHEMTLREIFNAIEGYREARTENLRLTRHFVFLLSNPHYKKLKVSDVLQMNGDKEPVTGFTKEDLEIFEKWEKADKNDQWQKE